MTKTTLHNLLHSLLQGCCIIVCLKLVHLAKTLVYTVLYSTIIQKWSIQIPDRAEMNICKANSIMLFTPALAF